MAQACESVGVAVTLSSDAGTFLCNELFFRLLERASGASTSTAHHNNFIAGFIHVPQLPEQASQRGGPHMDTHVAARAVHAMLHAVSTNRLPKLA
jgi:pyroglutamyl-peptidase